MDGEEEDCFFCWNPMPESVAEWVLSCDGWFCSMECAEAYACVLLRCVLG